MENARHVLITGCSGGIGHALALAFHQQGFAVTATARDKQQLSALQSKGMRCLSLDVTNSQQIEAVVQTLPPIDILVNNAGYGAMGPVSEISANELALQFSTNVLAPVALIQAVVPGMQQRKSGIIINIGSASGVLITPFSGVYGASKAALHALSDALRMELAPFNINVITVQPGAIESSFAIGAQASLQRGWSAQGSAYKNISAGIQKRVRASQQNPTSATLFAEKLVSRVNRKRPPGLIRLGHGAALLPALKRWIPTAIMDWILARTFKLNQLK